MGPLALISDELRAGRLLAPIREPALRTRGYFVYAPEASSDAPAVAALRKWLVAAGSLAAAEFPTYLSAIGNRSDLVVGHRGRIDRFDIDAHTTCIVPVWGAI